MDIKNFKTYTNESGFNTPTNLLCKLCPKDVQSGGTCSFFAEGNNPGCLKEDYYIECTYDVVANRDSGGTIINFPVTKLYASNTFGATAMTIDGGESIALTTGHTFDAEGEHTVKFYKGSKFTSLGRNPFSACTRLTSVKGLGDITGLTTASPLTNNGVFRGCTKLKSVDFSNKCKKISAYAFFGCSSLTDVGDMSGLEEVDYDGFLNCVSLKKINLSYKLKKVGEKSFMNCSNLEYIGDLRGLQENVVTQYPDGAFNECVIIKQKIILISLTNINRYLFRNCSSIPEIYIENCLSIQQETLSGCINLAKITINCTEPPQLLKTGDCSACRDAFDDTGNCPIYVPEESVQAYKTATNWTRYASRIKPMKKYR